ncbi:SDR family NAD(P)-dependent oxidoreductase [Basfia succiniciproducens]|uniref:SDR family NAD(P)-dependent oxidoreductase n=1 Tax=Basfia succiniciproducens TaxID=653940 RepID=UPI003FCEA28B
MQRFEQKTALVTGAGTGIGQAIAVRLAQEGANVLVVGRTEKTLQETTALHPNIAYAVADIEKDDDLQKIVQQLNQKYGGLDILINNAGWAPVTPISQVKIEEYDKVFGINVRALVNLTLQCLPMLKARKGNIINMSSAICRNHLPNMSMYAGTKAAIEIFTKIWAKELGADGVRVNSISVGPIETPIYDKTDLSNDGIQDHIDRIRKTIPLGAFGKSEDVANVTAFLASDEARFITGSDYSADGGFGA